jgi:hypothetical protein
MGPIGSASAFVQTPLSKTAARTKTAPATAAAILNDQGLYRHVDPYDFIQLHKMRDHVPISVSLCTPNQQTEL